MVKKKVKDPMVNNINQSTTNDQIQVVTPYITVTITSKENLDIIKTSVEDLLDKYKLHYRINEVDVGYA